MDGALGEGGQGPGAEAGAAADTSLPGTGDGSLDLALDARRDGTVRGGQGGGGRGGAGGIGGVSGAGGVADPDAGMGDDALPAGVDAAVSPLDMAIAEAAPLPPPANDRCAAAKTIPLVAASTRVNVSTRGATHDVAAPCAATGGDVFLSFTLSQRELVYADTFGATWNTVLFFTDECEAAGTDGGAATGPVVCSDDSCGTGQSQAVALLGPGLHYLVVAGRDGDSGDVALHFEHAPVGSGQVAALGAGSSSVSGATSGNGRLSLCEAGGPEDSYWWTSCGNFAGGNFMASTCTGTIYDTILALQIPRSGPEICNDDACNFQSLITAVLPAGAGLYVLTVDGFTGRHAGPYTLTSVRP